MCVAKTYDAELYLSQALFLLCGENNRDTTNEISGKSQNTQRIVCLPENA